MTDYRNRILIGDVREQLAALPDESVHCVVTSPPYWGLRDYGTAQWEGGNAGCDHTERMARQDYVRETPGGRGGSFAETPIGFRNACGKCGARRIDSQLGLEPTPEEYVTNLVAVFRDVRRVLRADGTCWVNLGDSYATGAGSVGARPGGGVQGDGWAARGVMTTPNRMPLPGLKSKDLVGIPWRVAFALQADGWWLRSDIIWSKPNPMPESVTDRPTKAHEYLFLLAKSQTYYYDAEAIRETDSGRPSGNGFVRPHRLSYDGRGQEEEWLPGGGRNRRTVWEIPTEPYAEAHFATYPTELVKPCIQVGTSERGCCPVCGAPWRRVVEREPVSAEAKAAFEAGRQRMADETGRSDGYTAYKPHQVRRVLSTNWQPSCTHEAEPVPALVLDPFMGSGTTALVALLAARDFVGIELNADYAALAERRILPYRSRLL